MLAAANWGRWLRALVAPKTGFQFPPTRIFCDSILGLVRKAMKSQSAMRE
jgi:hypothetical protein